MTQLKIENNPYAKAFREESTRGECGGHVKRTKSLSTTMEKVVMLGSVSPSSSPRSTCNSLTSIESGKELGMHASIWSWMTKLYLIYICTDKD